MRDKWKTVTLGDLCEFENGDRGKNYPGRKALVPSGIPFINAGHLDGGTINWQSMDFISRERYDLLGNGKIKKDDILFCLRGSLGKFGVVDKDVEGAIASSLVIVRPSREIDRNFLAAYFRSKICADMIMKYSNGAAQPNLSAKSLKLFVLPHPPLNEQKRIVAILDEAFAGIATAIANTEKNLANAHELFKSHLETVFNAKRPNWQETMLGEVYDIGSSKRVHKKDWRDSGVPFYRAREVVKLAKYGSVDNDLFISEEMYEEYAKRTGIPEAGDLMITAVGTLGVCYVVQPSDRFYFKDASVLWLRPKRTVNEEFIQYAFRSPMVINQIADNQGATVGTLTISRAKSISLPIPSLDVQSEVASSLAAIETETHKLQIAFRRKLHILTELKQSLLQKAFSGELTAKNIDNEIQEAVA